DGQLVALHEGDKEGGLALHLDLIGARRRGLEQLPARPDDRRVDRVAAGGGEPDAQRVVDDLPGNVVGDVDPVQAGVLDAGGVAAEHADRGEGGVDGGGVGGIRRGADAQLGDRVGRGQVELIVGQVEAELHAAAAGGTAGRREHQGAGGALVFAR